MMKIGFKFWFQTFGIDLTPFPIINFESEGGKMSS